MKNNKTFLFRKFLLAVLYFTLLVSIIYITVRIFLVQQEKLPFYEGLIAFFLLLAETFILIHGIGYLFEIISVALNYNVSIAELREKIPPLETNPQVLILIPSHKELFRVLSDTITTCYNLQYVNKSIILLDDTKYEEEDQKWAINYKTEIEKLCKKMKISLFRHKWRGAKAGIINDFLDFIEGKGKKESSLKNYGNTILFQKAKYIVIFDADQNPLMDFLEPLVALMEKDLKLAFIQTPQYYTNIQDNKIAEAAGLQQIVFYEYICEGKSMKEAMFSCGTNIIYRMKSLRDIGGFDEKTVTEDFATSLIFHLRGWKTAYYSKVGAFGMGPENLDNYFKQQFRWAIGTMSVLKTVLRQFLTHASRLSFQKWWEYFLSGSFYLIGFVYLILAIFPIIYILFRVPSYFANPMIYAVFFGPYLFFTFMVFLIGLKKRGYKIINLLLGQFLMMLAFPIFIKAAFYTIFGIKKKFEVTSKNETGSMSIYALWPQLILWASCFMAIVWAVNRIYYEREYVIALTANSFWCLYNFIVMSMLFYFNNPQEKKVEQPNILLLNNKNRKI